MNKKSVFVFTTQDIVEIAIFVAIAFILDLPFLKFRIGQNGGSISLSMLPLIIIAFRKGWFKGFIAAGIVYGLLTCLFDGYGFISYPFDYLLGFGSVFVVSFYKKLIFSEKNKVTFKGVLFIVISILSFMVLRTIFATISGMVIYKLNLVSSLIYNLTYLFPSFCVCLIVLLFLYKPLMALEKKH